MPHTLTRNASQLALGSKYCKDLGGVGLADVVDGNAIGPRVLSGPRSKIPNILHDPCILLGQRELGRLGRSLHLGGNRTSHVLLHRAQANQWHTAAQDIAEDCLAQKLYP